MSVIKPLGKQIV